VSDDQAEKGDRSNLPERPEGCCAQIGPVRFFGQADARSLKDRVRDYWNVRPCGTAYGQTAAGEGIDLERMAAARYALEPYILELADFETGRDRRVLEIGVGGGVDFLNWIRHGAQATGIDLTSAGVELTRQRLRAAGVPDHEYQLLVDDAENLRFEKESFDIVYSYGVLHHTPDTERALQEVYRVLAPGGAFRGMVYHVPSIVGWMLWVRYCLLRGRFWRTPRQAMYEHLESPGTKAYRVREMQEMLARAGFVDIQVRPRLSFGDLLQNVRSEKYRSPVYAIVWKLYPRWLIRLLGDRFGNALFINARKT
jgi:ubiquinone/menaquinone biosynthesis C-methylase UbiE